MILGWSKQGKDTRGYKYIYIYIFPRFLAPRTIGLKRLLRFVLTTLVTRSIIMRTSDIREIMRVGKTKTVLKFFRNNVLDSFAISSLIGSSSFRVANVFSSSLRKEMVFFFLLIHTSTKTINVLASSSLALVLISFLCFCASKTTLLDTQKKKPLNHCPFYFRIDFPEWRCPDLT